MYRFQVYYVIKKTTKERVKKFPEFVKSPEGRPLIEADKAEPVNHQLFAVCVFIRTRDALEMMIAAKIFIGAILLKELHDAMEEAQRYNNQGG